MSEKRANGEDLSTELLACPFCGSAPELKQTGGFWLVACDACCAQSGMCCDKDKIIEAWNARYANKGRGGRAAAGEEVEK